MKVLRSVFGIGLMVMAILFGIVACTGDSHAQDDSTEKKTDITDTTSDVENTDTESARETETEKEYADIGQGHFILDEETYYVVAGRVIPISGHYDFDEKATPDLTVMASDPEAVKIASDGTVTAAKAGDFTINVREEIYGTSAQAKLVIVGDITDNIIVSVPVWRGKWVNEEQFGYMRDAGVDMVVAVSGVETKDWSVSMNMCQLAPSTWHDGRGLFVLAHSTDDMLSNILSMQERDIKKIVKKFDGKVAFAGYHIIDEPYDCNPYTTVQRELGKLDPLALTDVNFLPGGAYSSMLDYEHRMDDYCRLLGTESNAYLSFDNYPFGPNEGTVNEKDLFGNFEAVRRAGLNTRTRTAFYLQAVGGFGNSYRRPNEASLTYHTASALAYGFKWIKYWSWFVPDYGNPEETYKDYTDAIIGKDGKPTDLYPVACDLHTRVHAIGPILVNCEADEVYHTGNRSTSNVYTKIPSDFFVKPSGNEYAIVSLMCDRTTGKQYLMFVNKSLTGEADMTFVLSGVDKVTVFDTRTGVGTETALTDNELKLHLKAGDFAFIGLPEGDFRTKKQESNNLALSDIVKITADESQGKNGCFVVSAIDGKRTSDNDSFAWRVPAKATGTMLFTFDKPVTMNRMDLYPAGEGVTFGSGFPKSVHVLAQISGEWVEIYANDEISRPTTEVPVIRFDAVTVNALKLVVSNGVMASDIAEVELYNDDGSIPSPGPTSYKETVQNKGENVALHKTPIASGSAYESAVDAWGLQYLTDGIKLRSEANGTNGWMAQGVKTLKPESGTVWGGVDLGSEYKINRIEVYPRENGNFFPSAYDIQISNDGETWTTVFSEENDTITTGEGRVIRLEETVTARFVRINGRTLRSTFEAALGGYLMQVSEIEVYWD